MKKELKTKKEEVKKSVVDTAGMSEIVPVTISGQSLTAMAKTFSTGSKGWYCSGKVVIDGLKCQVSCNIIVIGSKPVKEETK